VDVVVREERRVTATLSLVRILRSAVNFCVWWLTTLGYTKPDRAQRLSTLDTAQKKHQTLSPGSPRSAALAEHFNAGTKVVVFRVTDLQRFQCCRPTLITHARIRPVPQTYQRPEIENTSSTGTERAGQQRVLCVGNIFVNSLPSLRMGFLTNIRAEFCAFIACRAEPGINRHVVAWVVVGRTAIFADSIFTNSSSFRRQPGQLCSCRQTMSGWITNLATEQDVARGFVAFGHQPRSTNGIGAVHLCRTG